MYTIEECKDKSIWYSINKYHLLQSWNWGEFQRKIGRRVKRFIVKKNNEIVSIFQVILINSRFGSYIYVPNGPVFKEQNPWKENEEIKLEEYKDQFIEIIKFTKELGAKNKVQFIRIDPLFSDSKQNQQILEELGFVKSIKEIQPGHKLVINLALSLDELTKSMDDSTRYRIKKGLKEGIQVYKSINIKNDFEYFWNIYLRVKKRNSISSFEKSYYYMQLEFLKENGEYELFLAYDQDNKITAGAMVSFYNEVSSYLHAASDHQSKNASRVLVWEVIKEAQRRDCKYFDFYGIARDDNNLNDPWYGFTSFKKSFGGYKKLMLSTYDLPIQYLKYKIRRATETIFKYLK